MCRRCVLTVFADTNSSDAISGTFRLPGRYLTTRSGKLRDAEELLRRALAAADAARAPWVTAYARVELARARAAAGDADTAERLYRNALDWAARPRPHRARESLFVTIAGSPATDALVGLADLAAARGDAEAADELRAQAELAAA